MLNSNPKFLSPVVWCATNELVYLPGALALTVGSHLDLAARLRLHPDIQRINCTALYDYITIQPECLQPVMWIPMCCVEMHRIIRPLLCDIRIVGHKKVRNPAKYAAGFFLSMKPEISQYWKTLNAQLWRKI